MTMYSEHIFMYIEHDKEEQYSFYGALDIVNKFAYEKIPEVKRK